MKNFKLVFSTVAASLLAACSSMEVSEADAYAGNYPDDFTVAAYIQVHPELVRVQLADYVADYNSRVSASWTAAGSNVDSILAADEANFTGNTEMLHKMMVDPMGAGYTEADWTRDWTSGERDSVLKIYRLDTLTLSVADSTDESVKQKIVLAIKVGDSTQKVGSVERDAESGAVTALHGYSKCDSVCSKEDTLDITMTPTMLIRKIGKGDTVSTLVSSKDTTIMVEGAISLEHMNSLKKLNFIDTQDDYAKLKTVPLDSLAFSYQYALYGRSHGWAYRPCTEAEKAHPVITEEYPSVTKLYCDDNGKAREIN